MKDGFDVVTDVSALLRVQPITSQLGVGGNIFPDFRPDGRADKIDIVVNTTGIINSQMQIGYANVNIYKPAVTVGGKAQADQAGLRSLCKLVQPYLDGIWAHSFHTEIEEAGQIERDTDGSYFANITVKYYSLNTEFKNI